MLITFWIIVEGVYKKNNVASERRSDLIYDFVPTYICKNIQISVNI